MQDSQQAKGEESISFRHTKRITWAEEPWANESTPLLESGQTSQDGRPLRSSVLKGPKCLSKIGSPRSEQLPFYTDQIQTLEPEREEEDDNGDSRRGIMIAVGVFIVVVVVGALSIGQFQLQDPQIPIFPKPHHTYSSNFPPHNRAVLVKAKHGAISTENELCSNIGVETLKQGGNAADAAVSSTLCIGVVNMFSSGIGGGGFLTIRIPPHSLNSASAVYTIDFREVAPHGCNATMFEKDPLSSMFGGLSVGVPGEIRGLAELHRRWGKLPWKQLVEPSAKLARGWRVGPELDRRIQMYDLLMLYPDWQPIFAPNGKLLREGDFISRPALAKTLQTIADEGPEAFYKGPIADALLNKVKETGGIMTQRDLDNYEVQVRRALRGSYKGRAVYTTHAPSSGMVLLHMLNLVEPLENFVEDGRTGLNTHRMVEALKFGFSARTRVSDSFTKADGHRMEQIPSKEYADYIRTNLTDDKTHPPGYYKPSYDVPIDHGTSHGTTIDKDGMVVSITSSVNLVFGSSVLDSETGVILNDQMDDFSKPGQPNFFGLWPSPYNYPAAGKRPLSSISPVIIEDSEGNFQLALGASGGSRIFPAVFQTILGVDWGLDISEAIEFPRLHDQLFPSLVDIDSGYPDKGIQALVDRGHNVSVQDIHRITSVVQGVLVKDGVIYAASDSRKNGIAAGY